MCNRKRNRFVEKKMEQVMYELFGRNYFVNMIKLSRLSWNGICSENGEEPRAKEDLKAGLKRKDSRTQN